MKESVKLHDVRELQLLHSLINAVRSPTKVTKDTVSLIHVITKNKNIVGELATVMDLGYSELKVQILQLNVKTIARK
jgi:hypothetical protein